MSETAETPAPLCETISLGRFRRHYRAMSAAQKAARQWYRQHGPTATEFTMEVEEVGGGTAQVRLRCEQRPEWGDFLDYERVVR